MTLLLVLLAACTDEPRKPHDGLPNDTSVRVLVPANGASVESPFVLSFEAGPDVHSVRLDRGVTTIVAPTPVEDGAGELLVDIDPGRWTFTLAAEDASGSRLSTHEVVLRVIEVEESFVTITSPREGATLPAPISFTFEASADVASIEVAIDGAVVGSTVPDRLFTVPLDGRADPYVAEARAYDDEGALLASDEVAFTATAATVPDVSAFNTYVVDRLATYPTDGSYGYYWPEDGDWYGTTQDLWYLDELVAPGDPEHRSFCVGLTWELLMLSFTEIDAASGGDGSLNGLSIDDLVDFRIDWFVRDLNGDGPGVALEGYGLGERVTDLERVQPGDFIQFWRHSGSGHNAIFIDWERDPEDDAIIGVRYWSTQGSTSGVGYNEEFFGSSGSRIDPGYFYASRMAMPEDWIPWW
jgi:hypothetical protein